MEPTTSAAINATWATEPPITASSSKADSRSSSISSTFHGASEIVWNGKFLSTHGTDRWRPKLQNKWRFRSSSRRCTCTFQRGRNRLSQSPGRDVERPADVEPCVTFQQHAPSLSFITCVQRRITKVQRYNLGSDCLVEKTFKIWRANFRFKNQKKGS